jgi:uncharacterized membrane protein
MSAVRWVGPVLLALGIALIAAAVATGAAQLDLVVIFPVFVGGASALFLGGVASLLLGIFLLPLAFGGSFELESPRSDPSNRSRPPGSGGVVLIGPIPLFFGSWKHPNRSTWWAAVGVGAALIVAVLVLAAVFR